MSPIFIAKVNSFYWLYDEWYFEIEYSNISPIIDLFKQNYGMELLFQRRKCAYHTWSFICIYKFDVWNILSAAAKGALSTHPSGEGRSWC